MLGEHGAGSDDGALADAAVVEDGDAHADEHRIFNDTAVDGGVVADGDPVADGDGIEVALAVEDRAVLNIGVGADLDGVDVAAQDGIHPDGGVFAECDVAEELGGEIDIAAFGDARGVALPGAKHQNATPGASLKPGASDGGTGRKRRGWRAHVAERAAPRKKARLHR